MKTIPTIETQFSPIRSVSDLGAIIRAFRKSKKLTLEKVSDITNVSMRFLSELERGKETAELGKALTIINKLGLELFIQPRGGAKTISKQQSEET